MTERILVLSSAPESIAPLRETEAGREIEVVADPASALEAVGRQDWGAVLVDSGFAGGAGEEVARRVASEGETEVVLLARVPSLELTVRALQEGVREVMGFPPDPEKLLTRLRAGDESDPDSGTALPFAEVRRPDGLVGRHPSMLTLFRRVARVARADEPLLIRGEPGTGRTTLARILHRRSRRADRPMVELSADALPEGLLESELFGHERDTFPWAIARRIGRLERAHGGTLLLSGVDGLPSRLQLELLDTLRDGRARRVGSEEAYPCDVRLVASTDRDLAELVEAGDVLPDLHHRIASVTLRVPPLRDRGDDVVLLARHFGAVAARRCSAPAAALSVAAADRLRSHDWPGNVRELEQAMNHAVLVAEGRTIEPRHLPDRIRWRTGTTGDAGADEPPPDATLEEVEAEHVRRAIRSTDGNITRAADILGIHRNTLRRKLEKYDIRR